MTYSNLVKLFTTFFISVSLASCVSEQNQEEITDNIDVLADTLELPDPTYYYGIQVDSFDIVEGKIRWNQTLSDLLRDYNVSGEQLYEISRKSKDVYDVRKLKAGKEFSLVVTRDSIPTVRQFIFEPDLISYVIYHFTDSIHAQYEVKETNIEERHIASEINSSFYEAVLDAGAPPVLVSRLVDVLAWQVDFFRIMKGDKFKVIYEEESVDGEVVGVRKIKGVYFYHNGKEYYGIYYNQGTKSDYFDENGNSLRKTLLRAPLDYTRISSRYTPRRYHPVLKRYKAHLGTDYAAPVGTPIRTVGDGVVLEAQYSKYNGNYVKVRHNSNYTTQYLHMNKIKSGIRPGTKVKQGQLIGFVGQTGLANGPHLCFRFWKNGRQVDALNVDLPPSEPILASELSDYLHTKNVVLHQLKNIPFEEKKVLMAGIAGQQ